jgi:hypothetical protein
MCLAIFKPAGVELPDQSIRNGWISNPDGGGYALAKEGKLIVRKNFGKLAEFIEAYKKDAKDNPDSPFIVHFRIRSMGDKGLDNTHPFEFEHGALIHNGTISGTGAHTSNGPSDTKVFTDRFGKYLDYESVAKYKSDLDAALDWNKMVILYPDGRHHILNQAKGTEEGGVWYSNTTYKAYNRSSYPMMPWDYDS